MDKQYCKEVGNRLYNLRKDLNLTRAELGDRVGLHETTIKRYEDGGIKKLDIAKIKIFAQALETTSSYIMGWDEDRSILTLDDAILIKKYHLLDNDKKKMVMSLVDAVLKVQLGLDD